MRESVLRAGFSGWNMNLTYVIADLTPADRGSLITWLVILLVVVILGFGAILLVRRFLRAPADGQSHDPGFSLSELRAMRDRGEITPEEYELTRARVIAKVKGAPKPAAPAVEETPPGADDPETPGAAG